MRKLLFVGLMVITVISVGLNIYLISKGEIPLNKTDTPNGKEYTILLNKRLFFKVAATHDGNLDYFVSYTKSKNYQILCFHPTGFLQSLIQKNQNDEVDGRVYYFYKNSGFLSSEFPYEEGVISGNAVTYYDTSGLLKETMLYTDKGVLYYKETHDRNGTLIKKEGHK